MNKQKRKPVCIEQVNSSKRLQENIDLNRRSEEKKKYSRNPRSKAGARGSLSFAKSNSKRSPWSCVLIWTSGEKQPTWKTSPATAIVSFVPYMCTYPAQPPLPRGG